MSTYEKGGIFLDSIIAPAPLESKDIRRAQLTVAHHSMGTADCTMLLDMLGLNLNVDERE